MHNKISVIIPTMNRVKTLIDTMNSLCESSVYPNEIIIIDQSTNEDSQKEIRDYVLSLPLNVRYFHQEPSLTKARNTGFEKAENEILVFMDDDVIVPKDTFKSIETVMSDDKISMISGLNLNGGQENSKMGYIFGKKSYKNRFIGHVTKSVFGRFPVVINSRAETQWAMGFFFVVRKSLVSKWNLAWDERLISYGYPEDLDFSYRYYLKSRNEGLQCIIDPQISVYHMVSKEWRETARKVTFMCIINREYLSYKFGWGFSSRLRTRWANFGMFLQRLLKKDCCLDVLKAQFYCDRYRKDIKNGNLHTELYDVKKKQ